MALQKAIQPDWYQSMADGETWPSNTSRNRVRKSVERTLAHLDECLLVHKNSQVHTHVGAHMQPIHMFHLQISHAEHRQTCLHGPDRFGSSHTGD